MASDETMTFNSSMKDGDFDEDIIDDGFDHHLQHQHPNNLSRLSVCTSSTLCGVDDDVDEDDDDVDNAMTTYLSRLSIESSFGDGDGEDADGELSDRKEEGLLLSSDDSEKLEEVGSCYSLPATPPRRRNRVGVIGEKDYASDNGAQKRKGKTERNDERRRRRRNRRVKRMFDRYSWETMKKKEDHAGWFSGESDQSGCTGTGTGTGVVLITRPKGGKRSLCMGLEEVKACRDLGFELEHGRMLEIPSSSSRLSLETTSSGGNSPIANWRISGPGDDPRDVKARIKVWAQAVALASASKYTT